jgi:hypothetical protein
MFSRFHEVGQTENGRRKCDRRDVSSNAGEFAGTDGIAVPAGRAGAHFDQSPDDLEVKMTSDGYPIIPKAAFDKRNRMKIYCRCILLSTTVSVAMC